MTQLQIFKNERFGEIRTLEINKAVYFVGRDVANILGYAKPENALATHVDKEDTLKQGIPTNGGKQEMLLINESGLYSLILSSKLPTAKQFKRWVTSEVLPSIRKIGSYTAKDNSLRKQEIEIRLRNARVRESNQYLKIADKINIQEYKYILQSKAAETLAGEKLLPKQVVEEKTYSATEIGNMFGVSANMIGKLANTHHLKTDKYGKLFYDKSRHSCKEVETWRYYDNVISVFENLLKNKSA